MSELEKIRPTAEEKQDLRDFLKALYGDRVENWSMNTRVLEKTVEMIHASNSCSSAMDYVPRQMQPGASPLKYIIKQLGKAGLRAFLRDIKTHRRQYAVCLSGVAYKWRTTIELAARGN